MDARTICRLDGELGESFARAAARVIRRAGAEPGRVRAVGLHGQTICHLPDPRGRSATLQIGSAEQVAARCGVPVVSDFRQADVAAGGEGAPLSPLLDHALFKEAGGALVLNLGGIANMTAVPRNGSREGVQGFDTGPGNMVLDGIVRRLSRGRLARDTGGSRALEGKVSASLLASALEHPFFRGGRRSTGREEFGDAYVDRLIASARRARLRGEDLLATAAALTAESVWRSFRRRAAGAFGSTLWISGGGVHNHAILRELAVRFEPAGYRVRPLLYRGVTHRNRECALFALLAREFLAGRPANFPAATGARRTVRLGRWIPAR
jgi:anhydro-N-acetylmuramic acid kinase